MDPFKGADQDDLNDGTESASATVNIIGLGSVLTIQSDFAQFGATLGEATVTISGGGRAEFLGGASFGNVQNSSAIPGGTGHLSVSGGTSTVMVGANGISFGRGEGSFGALELTDGAVFENAGFMGVGVEGGRGELLIQNASASTAGLTLGQFGGQAEAVIDGGSLLVSGPGAWLRIGQTSGLESSLEIINGGSVVIDGQGTAFPGMDVGRAGGNGSLLVSGAESSLTITGDAPTLLDPNGFPSSGLLWVGRDAGSVGRIDILDGGSITHTPSGFMDVGRAQGVGVVTIDGVGSELDAGGRLRLGFDNGTGTVNVANGGSLSAGAGTSDEIFDIFIYSGSSLNLEGGASITGDILSNGVVVLDLSSVATPISVVGDFIQDVGGSLQILIDDDGGVLSFDGSVFLQGSLVISLVGDFAAGDTIVFAQVNGSFAADPGLDVEFLGLSDGLVADLAFDAETGSALVVIGLAESFSGSMDMAA